MTAKAAKDELPPILPLSAPWTPSKIPEDIDVPGLNSSAPVQDQIEQIEQLITIKLQSIDAHFSRAHHVLSTRILPAVRRYAVNTEPVREAARFWISFYEQAAQVRIPTTDDFSTEGGQQYANEDEDEREEREDTQVHDVSGAGDASEMSPNNANDVQHTFDPNVTPSESSFAPEALVSSTPMVGTNARQRSIHAEGDEETPSSWAASMESPLERLDKDLRSLREEQDSIMNESRQSAYDSSMRQSLNSSAVKGNLPVFTTQSKDKGKGRAQPQSLLQNVLSKNLQDAVSPRKHTSPLKIKQKTPKFNPYARTDAARAAWDGIVDLSKQNNRSRGTGEWSSGEEDAAEDGEGTYTYQPRDLPQPSSRFAARVGKTPVREAAARIGRDLIGRAEQARHPQPLFTKAPAVPDSPSTPSTPSLSIYARRALGMENSETASESSMRSGGGAQSLTTEQTPTITSSSSHAAADSSTEPSIESMMRHFGLEADANAYAASLESRMNEPADPEDSFEDSFDDGMPAPPVFASLQAENLVRGNTGGVGSDSSSDDDDGDGGNGAGIAWRGSYEGGDSDHSSDSLDGDEGVGADAPIHPFARGFASGADDSAFDDSFDNDGGGGHGDEEPTLFGVPPAQREIAGRGMPSLGSGSAGHLQLLGQEILEDTTALNQRVRLSGMPETPTPWGGG